jgi:cystathionine beta-lyase/cystathionine gamma-synthase
MQNHVHPETQCVHSGTQVDRTSGGVNTPIYTSSANAYLDSEVQPYPRYFNTVNQQAVVAKVGALEGGEDGVLFSSGMAAISTTALTFLKTGDHAVVQQELYGGTHAFVRDLFAQFGIVPTLVPTDAGQIAAAITKQTRLVIIESPTNPLLSVVDIRAVAAAARAHGAVTMIDNTFATPINQNPLALGIDVVVHSGTKYLGGHSDLCCGIAIATAEYASRIRHTALHLGGSLNALTCYLLERSLKTLAIRVERQNQNAGRLAEFLQTHPRVSRVNYPGLAAHPAHGIARQQMRGFGGMLSFELQPGSMTAADFMRRLRLIAPALSLGGVDTTICDPASTSHKKISAAERQGLGISDGLLRLSCGIEHAEDLIDDLNQALK